jgi:hypothetical protein
LDAIAELQPALSYELRNFEVPSLLGEAYLEARMPDRAAADYRKIPANHGLDGLSILYPLAYLGLARADAQMSNKLRVAPSTNSFSQRGKARIPTCRFFSRPNRKILN